MNKKYGWIVLLLLGATFLLTACAGDASVSEKEPAVTIKEIAGSDFKRIELSQKASDRLGIQTTGVLQELVIRQRLVGGEVLGDSLVLGSKDNGVIPVSGATGSGVVYVRVRLNESDLNKVDRSQAVHVLPLDIEDDDNDGEDEDGLEAEEIDGPDDDDLGEVAGEGALYYAIKASGNRILVAGQRVRVALSLTGSGSQSRVVPYAAVIYGLHGETWVYTNPEPLVFVRVPIVIDYIEGDFAVLAEGPAADTLVVTVGASELFGAESGVGGGH